MVLGSAFIARAPTYTNVRPCVLDGVHKRESKRERENLNQCLENQYLISGFSLIHGNSAKITKLESGDDGQEVDHPDLEITTDLAWLL